MKRWLSITFLILSSASILVFYQNCSRRQYQSEQNIHPELSNYVQKFTYQAEQYGLKLNTNSLTVQYSDHIVGRKEVVGYCYREPITSPNGDVVGLAPTILVKKDWWDSAFDYQKTDLLFHEMGHCLLDRKHVDDNKQSAEININQSTTGNLSIMNPILLSTRLSEENYQKIFGQLLEELFLSKKTSVSTLAVNQYSVQNLDLNSNAHQLPQLESNEQFRGLIQEEFFFSENGGCSQTNN